MWTGGTYGALQSSSDRQSTVQIGALPNNLAHATLRDVLVIEGDQLRGCKSSLEVLHLQASSDSRDFMSGIHLVPRPKRPHEVFHALLEDLAGAARLRVLSLSAALQANRDFHDHEPVLNGKLERLRSLTHLALLTLPVSVEHDRKSCSDFGGLREVSSPLPCILLLGRSK
ncbi:hypothetical protein WJX81_003764 [Elliptochloris bilobata]|uniref:Uncharacterized protein n=1 Tax=Elliptochloris bilobata TaxID=381761 RepID=A0AAW1SH31_9CHLO